MEPSLPPPAPIARMPAAHLIERAYYAQFADWLVREYLTKDGNPLHQGTLDGYIQYLMQEAKAHAMVAMSEDERRSVERFFTCSGGDGGTTKDVRWFRGLQANMRRIAVVRLSALGQQLDNSADPLYSGHIASLMRAYASHATVDAAKRKLLLYSLWLSAGQTNECCFLSFDSLRWDAHFGAVQVEIIQFKTSKAEKVAFVACILPMHQAIATSGHDMGGICEYYEYVESTMAKSMIGAQILAGWPAPTYGHSTCLSAYVK